MPIMGSDEMTGMNRMEAGLEKMDSLVRDGEIRKIADREAELTKTIRRRGYLEQRIEECRKRLEIAEDKFERADLKKRISHYEQDLEEELRQYAIILDEVNRMKSAMGSRIHYSKEMILRNIRSLLAGSVTTQLGRIEREASGCQPGYTARLERSNTEPSLEYVVTAAKILHMPLDLLVLTDLTSLTPTETYLISFLAKLAADTTAEKLDWKVDREVREPDIEVVSDRYNVSLDEATTLCLMSFRKAGNTRKTSAEWTAKEVWMAQKGSGRSLLCGTGGARAIADAVNHLYEVVEKRERYPRIKPSLRSVIDAYMEK